MLKVENLSLYYGRVSAVRGVSLEVNPGEIVALLGANGAGKTSLLNAIAGVVAPEAGYVEWENRALLGLPPHKVVGRGIGYVPEGRQLFGSMRVVDNLTLGTYTDCSRRWYHLLGPVGRHLRQDAIQNNLQRTYELFPILAERADQLAGNLSGGEQQMLAIARALMCSPSILLLDEPSVGLAPTLVKSIFQLLARLRDSGLTILLVEQDAGALRVANRGYVMEQGRIVVEGAAGELMGDDKVRQAYLGKTRADVGS